MLRRFSATSVDCLHLDWRGLKNLNTLNLDRYMLCLLLKFAFFCIMKWTLVMATRPFSSFITLSSRFYSIKFHDRRMYVCRILLDSFKSACSCKNRPLKFWWKMDCPPFCYTSQETYAMDENDLISPDSFPLFFFIAKSKTIQNRKLKPQVLVCTRCMLKTCTFNKTT